MKTMHWLQLARLFVLSFVLYHYGKAVFILIDFHENLLRSVFLVLALFFVLFLLAESVLYLVRSYRKKKTHGARG